MHGGTTYDCLAKLPLHHLYSMICYAYTVLDNINYIHTLNDWLRGNPSFIIRHELGQNMQVLCNTYMYGHGVRCS